MRPVWPGARPPNPWGDLRDHPRAPGESARAHKWRVRRETYAAWIADHLCSIRDFELEAELLRGRAVRLTRARTAGRRRLIARQLGFLAEEFVKRETFGADNFSVRRADLAAKVLVSTAS